MAMPIFGLGHQIITTMAVWSDNLSNFNHYLKVITSVDKILLYLISFLAYAEFL